MNKLWVVLSIAVASLAAQAGLSVDIQSAASRDGRVEALLQIKGKTS